MTRAVPAQPPRAFNRTYSTGSGLEPVAGELGGAPVYPRRVVLQRRGGSGFVAVITVGLSALGCGGPLDSAEPQPTSHPDAGMDSGAGGKRAVDAAPDIIVVRDAAVDISYPIIPGCVSGLPPAPQMNPNPIPPIAVGCSSSTSVLGTIFDSAGQGMVYGALLNPPIDGLALSARSILCGSNFNDPIYLVVRQSAFHPGASYTTSLSITPSGPPPQKSAVFGLSINVVPIDFSIDPEVLDFGNVTIGEYRRQALTVANAATSAPFDILYPSPQQQGPFLLLNLPVGQSLQPGGSVEMLEASINAQVPGNYEATFLVSTFQPGVLVDPACGVIRSVVMRAQVSGATPPVP